MDLPPRVSSHGSAADGGDRETRDTALVFKSAADEIQFARQIHPFRGSESYPDGVRDEASPLAMSLQGPELQRGNDKRSAADAVPVCATKCRSMPRARHLELLRSSAHPTVVSLEP
jgi:hypothetical protein